MTINYISRTDKPAVWCNKCDEGCFFIGLARSTLIGALPLYACPACGVIYICTPGNVKELKKEEPA